jgi:hypothetical protein
MHLCELRCSPASSGAALVALQVRRDERRAQGISFALRSFVRSVAGVEKTRDNVIHAFS